MREIPARESVSGDDKRQTPRVVEASLYPIMIAAGPLWSAAVVACRPRRIPVPVGP